ncbi:uncharacterized protein [Centruroides vittatus]|uniref:uncharacterized protein n=1 Tax=Centruroides vittatus TaxID=120091 RepID=UPI00350EF639
MEIYETTSQKKRSSSGEGLEFTPPASKRRLTLAEAGNTRQTVKQTMRDIISDLQKICLDRDNKITKQAADKILSHTRAFQDLVIELLADNERLQGKLEQQQTFHANKQTTETESYAQVTKRSTPVRHIKTGVTKPKQQKVLFVKPMDSESTMDSDELKQKFIKAIDPRKDRIKFRQIRKLRNKCLMLEVEGEEDANKIIQHPKLRESGLKAQPQNKRNPRIIIYDVPRNIDEKDLPQVMHEMNSTVFIQSPKQQDFKLLFKTGKRRDDLVNWVVETSPDIRNSRPCNRILYVDYCSCKARDYVSVSRCFKCQSYGHVAKYCRETEEVCSHCMTKGHRYKDCPKRQEPAQCAACKKLDKPHTHMRNSKQCTAYKMAVERYLSTTQFE